MLVADDDLVAGNGKLPRQQIALSVDRRRKGSRRTIERDRDGRTRGRDGDGR